MHKAAVPVKFNHRLSSVVIIESDNMVILPSQANVLAAVIFTKNDPGFLVWRIGQLAMERVTILRLKAPPLPWRHSATEKPP